MTWRVVLPSWSLLAQDLQVETGCRHPAFIPLGGWPLFRHIAASPVFARSSRETVLVLSGEAIEPEPEDLSASAVKVIRLDCSRSIGETVLAGLSELPEGAAVVVNMADTLVRLDQELRLDAVYTQARADLYRWTTIEVDAAGRVQVTHDRDAQGPVAADQEVCVGLFAFADGSAFKRLLQDAVVDDQADKPGRVEPLFLALRRYSCARPMRLVRAAHWFDCGHVDTYYESRLGYQNLRHFNSLAYDPLKGLVTKTSDRVEQFRHQVRWFKQVPDGLAAFLPRIFDSSDSSEPFITMELLTIPTLSELFVSGRLSPGAWNGVVRTLSFIQSELTGYGFRSGLAYQMARRMYLDKTRERLLQFEEQRPDALALHLQVAGRRVDVRHVLQRLDDFVARSGLLELQTLTPIHGDFCFSNLLFDPKSKVVKMIDPRGEFGVPGIYGDRRYDLAKLSHSFSGGYDFIVSDRFDIAVDSNGRIDFQSRLGAYHRQVRAIFEISLLQDPVLAFQVQAVEALLFLSMLPLHSDAPRRQLAMLATGLQLFARCEAEAGA